MVDLNLRDSLKATNRIRCQKFRSDHRILKICSMLRMKDEILGSFRLQMYYNEMRISDNISPGVFSNLSE